MSREIKVCNVDTLNNVNDKVRNLQYTVQRDIATAQRIALNTASADAQRRIEQAKEEMQDRMNKTTSYINGRLQTLDTNHRQALRNLSNQVYDKMSDMNRDIHNDMDTMNRNIRQLAHEVDNRFERQRTDIDNIRQDVDSLFEGLRQRHNAGKEAVSMANELLDIVRKRTDLVRFAPEKWHEIHMRIDALNGISDDSACIAQANEICIQTMLAEEEAVKNKLKHDDLVCLATKQLVKVFEVINSNRTIRISNLDSRGEVVKIEANFWTRGDYQKVLDELEKIKNTLDEPYAKEVTSENLHNMLDRISYLEKNGNELIQTAIERAVLSENRVVVTEDIVTALIEQGYEVKLESGTEAVNYMGGDQDNDWREGVYAVMEKGSGEEITVIVRPDENAVNNQIIFHRNDERTMTDAQYLASLERIKKEIEKSGHRLGELQVPADGGNTQIPELRSGTSMSRKGMAQKLDERVRV